MKNKFSFKPYLIVTTIWAILSFLICFQFSEMEPFSILKTGLKFLLMAIFNLVFLVKMIEISVKLMSDQLIENKSKEKLNLLLWGSLKLLSIGVLFVFIYKYNEKSILPCLLCGIGTLFIVPLMGGAFWNFFWNDEVNEQGRV